MKRVLKIQLFAFILTEKRQNEITLYLTGHKQVKAKEGKKQYYNVIW